jgi:hypothetical protein
MTVERCERGGSVIANTMIGRTLQSTGLGLALLAPAADCGRWTNADDIVVCPIQILGFPAQGRGAWP